MNSQRDRGRRYANMVSIIQSSGTGKSRTIDELARAVFTLPVNLRDDGASEGGLSFAQAAADPLIL